MSKFACYLCHKPHLTSCLLINHLKEDHGLQSIAKYVCKEENCNQIFHNVYRFRKHLEKHKTVSFSSVNNDLGQSLVSQEPLTQLQYRDEYPLPSLANFKHSVLEFTLELHNHPHFSRKDVLSIQKSIKERIMAPIVEMVNPLIQNFENKVLSNEILRNLSEPFKNVDSEYKFLKELENLKHFKHPQKYVISNELSGIILNNNPTLTSAKAEIVLNDIPFQIKQFFESEGVWESIIANVEIISKFASYYNFINGDLWKTAKFDEGKLTIPLFLYMDDFEINDPLGSKSCQQKICGIYYTFPTIPNYQAGRLMNVFVSGFMKSSDICEYGFNIAFTPLIDILKKLYVDGLSIDIGGQHIQVYIRLAQILGDNLGLNTALGYNSSFSSNSFCRVCKRNKNETRIDCIEYSDSLRNNTNYELDITLNDPAVNGIKYNSVFNSLSFFHVTDNISCDIMHDLFSGVCKYNFSKILHYFIYEKKMFTLETFNSRKQMFQYGQTEIGNVSPPVKKEHIKNANFKMNAKQMQTFSHLVLLMIGDLIPPNDSVYKFLVLFIQLIDYVLLPNFDDDLLIKLQVLIEEHNRLYQCMFKDTLKPKHHNLVHYPTIIKKLGPLKYLWSFRFEAEHQIHKKYARSITSRINIPLSLGIKSAIRFANSVITNNFFQAEIVCKEQCPITKEIYISSLNLSDLNSYKKTDSVIFRGKTFKIGHIVSVTKASFLIYEIYGPPIDFYVLNNGLKVIRAKKYW
ncbi:uncharacterized protein LOC128922130 [Zeugodacus cucurbitae]|uniref:uncharacterized protein LOC128922130 n=1 Tax=Zeugodacus cucurbitae TaxID=28588 RepID=UPI0023D90C82|nr:uncharacterized protein LOC128922130 [Zeugodacus cucurbitae]